MSAYWNSSQETLHPMPFFYMDGDGYLQHSSYVAVSDVAIIERLFKEVMDLPGCNEILYVQYRTDIPTSQYRNRYIFHAVANHESMFSCPLLGTIMKVDMESVYVMDLEAL